MQTVLVIHIREGELRGKEGPRPYHGVSFAFTKYEIEYLAVAEYLIAFTSLPSFLYLDGIP